MLSDAPIVAFVPATDLDRACAFYADRLGLTVEDVNDVACVLRGAGTMLRVTKVERFTPQGFTVLGWEVADIRATLHDLAAAGVEAVRYDGVRQDDLGVWTAPGGGQIAWFRDPDGNTVSVTQF